MSEGVGQVFEAGKDEPLQLSDIIPKEAVYDKMRPPKVEGKKKTPWKTPWKTPLQRTTNRLAVVMQQ